MGCAPSGQQKYRAPDSDGLGGSRHNGWTERGTAAGAAGSPAGKLTVQYADGSAPEGKIHRVDPKFAS
jgi:hypothetical protein